MLRVGTRCSKLALTQTHEVISKIQSLNSGIRCEVVEIKTTGDIITDRPLVDIGGKALFLKEIEESLLSNKIDIAVHSLKDVPAILPDNLIIPAVTERIAPEDVLISKHSLLDLPSGSTIGTCSARRKAFLMHLLGSKINVVNIRGNVDTRISKFKRGEVDGILLARAGLERLGLSDCITEVISPDMMLPAIGQGVIAIECREDRADLINILKSINHQQSYVCIMAERGFMIEMGGNCETPIAAFASLKNDSIELRAAFIVPNGEYVFNHSEAVLLDEVTSHEAIAHDLGVRVAQQIKSEMMKSEYFNEIKHLFET
jgi:hydroxymethylbilane synthase